MNNQERLEFLKEKPTYSCRFHPTQGWHVVGCSHKDWTKEELQDALDKAKRALELQLEILNEAPSIINKDEEENNI